MCLTMLTYGLLNTIVGLRVSADEEDVGLDKSYHGRYHPSIYPSIYLYYPSTHLSISSILSYQLSAILGESLTSNGLRLLRSNESGTIYLCAVALDLMLI